jgi:hypothetical protein
MDTGDSRAPGSEGRNHLEDRKGIKVRRLRWWKILIQSKYILYRNVTDGGYHLRMRTRSRLSVAKSMTLSSR